MSNLHKFDIYQTHVDDAYIASCANNYLRLLTATTFNTNELDKDPRLSDLGFATDTLKKIIKKYSVPVRNTTSKKNDIYRSDLGELLMVSFFEKRLKDKYPNEENFIIPIKNISNRENIDMPARGLDVVGYRLEDVITLLLGEAKVSDEKESPPQVVDKNDDSLYKTHTLHRTDKGYLLKKLANIATKLSYQHSYFFLQVIGYIEEDKTDKFKLVYGCCLLRDSQCHQQNDFGKMRTCAVEFEPNSIHFVVVCFDSSIADTVNRFHNKVMELTN